MGANKCNFIIYMQLIVCLFPQNENLLLLILSFTLHNTLYNDPGHGRTDKQNKQIMHWPIATLLFSVLVSRAFVLGA